MSSRFVGSPPALEPGHSPQRASAFKAFVHKRSMSKPSATSAAEQSRPKTTCGAPESSQVLPLGERLLNLQSPQPPSPTKSLKGRSLYSRTQSLLAAANGSSKNSQKENERSPTRVKTRTGLVGMLSRPKSSRDLRKLAGSGAQVASSTPVDKENQIPARESTSVHDVRVQSPIYAQITDPMYITGCLEYGVKVDTRGSSPSDAQCSPTRSPAARLQYGTIDRSRFRKEGQDLAQTAARLEHEQPRLEKRGHSSRPALIDSPKGQFAIQSDDVEIVNRELEALLERQNIPEGQRYKMRNVALSVKLSLIKHERDESTPMKSKNASKEADAARDIVVLDSPKKRPRSRTFTHFKNKSESPTKAARTDGRFLGHFRNKSTESLVTLDPVGHDDGLSQTATKCQRPLDFFEYLRQVQRPEEVEVGRMQKLKQLLRNEKIGWTDEFIFLGGMEEIVALLERIFKVEWREEHEDALLHESLLCLKALCTTTLALTYLDTIHNSLFPSMLACLFSVDKKGPSEFQSRNIIISLLFVYLKAASLHERHARAKTILSYLRDPVPDAERVLPFVMEMHRERPYRLWHKEANSVVRDVFWIFLHSLNVISRPTDRIFRTQKNDEAELTFINDLTYVRNHFPRQMSPVPAAPHIGSVEWEATNYLASHLELLNGIMASLATRDERNKLRSEMRISGWEKLMGGSLRTCKEKLFPSVHEGLRCWVAAALEDGWEVSDVRCGPPVTKNPAKSPGGSPVKVTGRDVLTEAPRLELHIGGGDDAWKL